MGQIGGWGAIGGALARRCFGSVAGLAQDKEAEIKSVRTS